LWLQPPSYDLAFTEAHWFLQNDSTPLF